MCFVDFLNFKFEFSSQIYEIHLNKCLKDYLRDYDVQTIVSQEITISRKFLIISYGP